MNKPKFSVGDKVWHPEYGWGNITTLFLVTEFSRRKYSVVFQSHIERIVACGWWELFYDEVELPNPPKPESLIDWTKVPPGTVVEVRDAEYSSWKRRKFLAFSREVNEDRFWTLSSYAATLAIPWKQCRLAPEVEIKEEWLK